MVPLAQAVPSLPAAFGPLAGGAPPLETGAAIGPRDAWRVIKQRKLMIIITLCVSYVVVLAATFLVWRFVPTYTNEAYVRLIPPIKGLTPLEEQILPKDYITHQLATEAAQIKNQLVLQDVLALPEIKETEFYRWYGDNFDKCLYQFGNLLNVAPVRESYLIRVAIAVRNRSESKLIVNRVVERYLSKSKSSFTDEGRERVESLKNTRAKVEEELRGVRDRVKNLRERQDMPAIEAQRDVVAGTLVVLNNTLAELMTRIADIEAQLGTIRGVDPRNLPLSAEMQLIIESDPILRYYRQQVEAMDIQIDVSLKNLMGENNRQMRALMDQRQGVRNKETQRREELIDDLRARQVEALQQEMARMRNMAGKVHEQLMEKENIQRDLDKVIQDFTNLTTEEERLSKELEQVSLAQREAENTLSVQQREGRLQPLYASRDPYWPSRPNFLLYLGGGFVLSVLVAIGLAFLRELTDQAIRTPIDIARHGRLSVLGSVPLLDDEQADVDSIELATRRAPHSLVAEAFRQIRAHLTFSGPLDSQRVLLITSPRPEDGKTATAINLAVTFAQGNQRVLLIDCNFRRPGIRAAFPSTRPEGLSNVLVGHSRLDQVICRTDLPNLDVVSSGPMPPNPAELLGSAPMRDLIERAKKSYDRVLLDGPPCLLISDALVVAMLVDATVMVARAAASSKGALRRAREQFQRINARIIGAILNGAQTRPGGYFREQYREFYEYASEEVVPQELPGGPPEIDTGPASSPDDPGKP
jgi:capsular exopolysaccharide synthesis family protein